METDKKDMESALKALEDDGFVVLSKILDDDLLERIRADVDKSIEYCSDIQRNKNVGQEKKGDKASGALHGTAHHALSLGESFFELLEQRPYLDIIEAALDSKIILNSYGVLKNVKRDDMYEHGMTPHRDIRSYRDFREMYFLLIMVDDFTEDNGATYLLPGSHKKPDEPSNDEFFTNSARALGPAGTIAIFDPRVFHAAGINTTDNPRRVITISFTRPNHKPQFDFVRDVGEEKMATMSDNLKQLIGYYARVPASHEEWYQEPEDRYYQMDQG